MAGILLLLARHHNQPCRRVPSKAQRLDRVELDLAVEPIGLQSPAALVDCDARRIEYGDFHPGPAQRPIWPETFPPSFITTHHPLSAASLLPALQHRDHRLPVIRRHARTPHLALADRPARQQPVRRTHFHRDRVDGRRVRRRRSGRPCRSHHRGHGANARRVPRHSRRQASRKRPGPDNLVAPAGPHEVSSIGDLSDFLACPRCDQALATSGAGLRCGGCRVDFPIIASIPWLFAEPNAALGEWRGRLRLRLLSPG